MSYDGTKGVSNNYIDVKIFAFYHVTKARKKAISNHDEQCIKVLNHLVTFVLAFGVRWFVFIYQYCSKTQWHWLLVKFFGYALMLSIVNNDKIDLYHYLMASWWYYCKYKEYTLREDLKVILVYTVIT